jgi:hypothetical protein
LRHNGQAPRAFLEWYREHIGNHRPQQNQIVGKSGMNWLLWIKVAAGVLVVALILAYVISGPYGQTVAAWVQAIGSIAAIGGAAWLAQGQVRQSRIDDMEETRAFIQGVVVELTVVWNDYTSTLGQRLRNTADGEILLLQAGPRNRVFVIYPNNSARLGKVKDAELRRLIVDVYTRAENILHAFKALHQTEQRQFLVQLTRTLKAEDLKLSDSFDRLLRQAESWLAERE